MNAGYKKAAGITGFRRLFAAALEPQIVPRSPSLELYVLPNGGGQLLY